MNRDKINSIKTRFENLYYGPLPKYPDKGFSMGWDKFHPRKSQRGCGTAACLIAWCLIDAGVAYVDYAPSSTARAGEIINPNYKFAQEYIDITPTCAALLFTPKGYNTNPRIFTLPAAIRVLELLLEHGTMIDPEVGDNMWNRAIEEQSLVVDRLEKGRPAAPKTDWIVELAKPDLKLIEGPVRKTCDEPVTMPKATKQSMGD